MRLSFTKIKANMVHHPVFLLVLMTALIHINMMLMITPVHLTMDGSNPVRPMNLISTLQLNKICMVTVVFMVTVGSNMVHYKVTIINNKLITMHLPNNTYLETNNPDIYMDSPIGTTLYTRLPKLI